MKRLLHLLWLGVAVAGLAGCTTTISGGQIPCQNDGQCQTGYICGEDKFCRLKPKCNDTTQDLCSGVCTDLDTTLDCGGCGKACADGEKCQPSSDGDKTKATCSTFCKTGLTDCSGTCRDEQNDRTNCGACGKVCDSGKACVAGQCTLDCQAGLTNCSGLCVDKNTDRANCGACGTSCNAGEVCSGGECVTSCPGSLAVCGSSCVDKQTDEANCGACGNSCAPGFSCVSGQCSLVCQNGLSTCAVAGTNTCVDKLSDPRNCGTCGNACGAGEACSAGTCVANCPTGQTYCGAVGSGQCVDLKSDAKHCGTCTGVCAAGEACVNSNCQLSCQAGLTNCDVSGVPTCVDTKTDARFCGTCAKACNAGEVCSNGTCALACPSGLTQCGSSCVNTQTDSSNCGSGAAACGNTCGAGSKCIGGQCTLSCPSGSTACPTNSPTFCTATGQDNNNCGACGNVCGAGTSCQGGSCLPTCDTSPAGSPRQKLCGDQCKDIKSDPNNCGDCGAACGSGKVCSNGVCQTTCGSNLTLCADGTCRDTQNDPQHCGGCTNAACGVGLTCVGGVCGSVCGSGQTSCGGVCTNTKFDPNNCGTGAAACGNSCSSGANATGVCNNGTCAALCSAGFADCDHDGASCETNTQTDAANCGACGLKCTSPDNAAASCQTGLCGAYSCSAGFGDCDPNQANGCETSFADDALHCGGTSCGAAVACAGSTPFCTSGACSATLPTGVMQNVQVTDLTGYTVCHTSTFADSGTSLAAIQSACTGANLVIGCRAVGSSRLLIAAAGPKTSVFTDTGAGNATTAVGGVGFYFTGSGAMGFAPVAAAINRSGGGCDTNGTSVDAFVNGYGSQRMCWTTNSGLLGAGARCGDTLGASSSFERVILSK
ncbi:MAG: hypothetical protein JST92_10205 [Deltaproteobacteria bacterium]|nr:hypothetical protein [Deltaproteobacteria bacterium]